MADSLLIPGIVDHIVKEEIIPRLPWHTRPLLMALGRPWTSALEAIGVQGGNRLDPIGEHIARVTRLKQPLKCRLAVEYHHMLQVLEHVLKIFDGQWRNLAPIIGRGEVLGVVDGRLYFCERLHGPNRTVRIIALDVGSGLWQWKEVCRRESHRDLLLRFYLAITEIPAWEQITDRAPDERFKDSPQPIFVHMGNRLYFFGAVSYTDGAPFFDLNTRAWLINRIVEGHFGGSLNVEKNVLLVAYDGTDFHILRYDSSNERWISVGWMVWPLNPPVKWTWCVEYDHRGEKQLWIYICSLSAGGDFKLWKWQVLGEGSSTIRKVWEDIALPEGEVECELLNRTALEPFNNGNAPVISVDSLHGFHRSDSTNFEDIPAIMCPISL